jgi:hypothetical protein
MKYLLYISRILVGALFLFSGFVKGVDPYGSVFKFNDYLTAFGFENLKFLSLPAAYLLCIAEFLTGFMLLTRVRIKTAIFMSAALMLFFTPLTLILAVKNPVSDCGCFGDAIHLTNWQTFYKNVVLSLLIAVLVFKRSSIQPLTSAGREWIISALTSAAFAVFIAFNQLFLPVIDFLPYKKNVSIKESMTVPEGSKPDRYETTFIYEKNGEKKEFNLENYPAGDTTWIFVDARSVLVEKGYTPPIHDFMISDINGESISDSILDAIQPVFITIIRNPEKIKASTADRISTYGKTLERYGADFFIFTPLISESLKSSGLKIGRADETTLKSMVRTDPGHMLLFKGKIIGKWSDKGLPDQKKMEQKLKSLLK